MGKNKIENINLNSIKDNNKFDINAVEILYSLPINSFTLINDEKGEIYLAKIKDFQNEIICNISSPQAMELAKKEGKTRSQICMRMAASNIDGGIVVIGNAPTALLEVIQMVKEGLVKPALIIGIPVGFISSPESKEELAKLTEVDFITNIGRKGGSSSASAIINALYKLLRAELGP